MALMAGSRLISWFVFAMNFIAAAAWFFSNHYLLAAASGLAGAFWLISISVRSKKANA